ncbi:hypothetical protein Acid7E03_41790 [Acidisoma sp. 7E03]
MLEMLPAPEYSPMGFTVTAEPEVVVTEAVPLVEKVSPAGATTDTV